MSRWQEFRKRLSTPEGVMEWARAVVAEDGAEVVAIGDGHPNFWSAKEGHTIVANYISCCVNSSARESRIANFLDPLDPKTERPS
jgi:hypothetical protein